MKKLQERERRELASQIDRSIAVDGPCGSSRGARNHPSPTAARPHAHSAANPCPTRPCARAAGGEAVPPREGRRAAEGRGGGARPPGECEAQGRLVQLRRGAHVIQHGRLRCERCEAHVLTYLGACPWRCEVGERESQRDTRGEIEFAAGQRGRSPGRSILCVRSPIIASAGRAAARASPLPPRAKQAGGFQHSGFESLPKIWPELAT